MARPKKTMTKTAFVLGMPSASVGEVVAAAAKAGIALKENYVHTIRYNAKNKGRKGGGSTPSTRRAKNGRMSATEFVLRMPGATAKEIVPAAKKAGIKLTERYVYVIRSAAKAKARRGGATRGDGAAAVLRRAIGDLGLARARQVLAEVESAFRRR